MKILDEMDIMDIADKIGTFCASVFMAGVIGFCSLRGQPIGPEPNVLAQYGEINTGSLVEVVDKSKMLFVGRGERIRVDDTYYSVSFEDEIIKLSNQDSSSPTGTVFVTIADYNNNGRLEYEEGEWAFIEKWVGDVKICDYYSRDGKNVRFFTRTKIGERITYYKPYMSQSIYKYLETFNEDYGTDIPGVVEEMDMIANDMGVYLEAVDNHFR